MIRLTLDIVKTIEIEMDDILVKRYIDADDAKDTFCIQKELADIIEEKSGYKFFEPGATEYINRVFITENEEVLMDW